MKTLKHLQDYFSTTDNTHVQRKLELLEKEIELAILEAEVEILKKVKSISLK